MNKEYDFSRIGKRMPYTTPDGFFDKLQDDIWKEVKQNGPESGNGKAAPGAKTQAGGRKPGRLRLVVSSVMAVAASVALVLALQTGFTGTGHVSTNDVDKAFSQLSTDDQDYLLNVYQNDVFINE